MTNYREILRMHSLGFNKTEISQSLTCSRTTVRTVIHLAESLGLSYPLPKDTSDKVLYEALFPSAAGKAKYKMPDYEHVHKEPLAHWALPRPEVFRILVFQEE